MTGGGPNPMRSFDPRRVGALECATWVAYYRRDWPEFMWAGLALVRHAFGLPLAATVRGAWLVLRANQAWAPYPENDPDRARRCMLRFYQLVATHHGESFDVERAACLEIAWWQAHRELQDGAAAEEAGPLVDALTALLCHVYGAPADTVRPAAAERARAIGHSDRWVAEGCAGESPLIAAERAALVRSYAALLAAVHRAA